MNRRKFLKAGLLWVPAAPAILKSYAQDVVPLRKKGGNGLLNSLSHFYRFQESAALFADVGSSATNTPLNYTNAGQGFSRVAGHAEPFAGNYDGVAGFDSVGTIVTAPQDFGGGASGVLPLTFALWFKPSNVQPNNGRTAAIIGTWDNDTQAGQECWVVVLNAADNTKCQLFTRDFSTALKNTSTVGTITLNSWNLFCGGWDSATNVCWLSLNNVARSTAAQTSLASTVGGAVFRIANMNAQRETNMSFEGVGIWQRNFTATDISNLWNGGNELIFANFTT